ncbi:nitroreductase family protein [Williamwhitmania taraxaci]|uniref:Nitroreductase n=1 Tax=Williamwhitmania taraxaci TaxID=1640674 RepID=A0A1G6HPQ6_9BACT|nr:nitroreductase family protein [Williamwhitmania taraxaci]SDB96269.1 Nitroreductase [Williamwhitmania taraxaci]
MNLSKIVVKNRSYRRFYQERPVLESNLLSLVDLARLSPSGRNLQPLKYCIINDAETCAQLFPLLAWAGYLKDWAGPEEGERPSAYIVMVEDTSIAAESAHDQGISAQSIMLGAVELGFGGCMIASIKRKEISELLNFSENLKPVLVLALGVPKEVVCIDPMPANGDVKYWRDEHQVHHVPKRLLSEIILKK